LLKETPAMHEGTITIRIPADLNDIERMCRLVRQFGELHDVPSRTLYAVNLALDETVTNIVQYAYDDPRGKELLVRLEVSGNELRGDVVDEGRAFNPLEAAVPDLAAPLPDREPGGLGIHLVRSLIDRLSYRREDGKNVLTMSKRIR
jgi:serine/threonine-protein kinase RsbW